MSVRSRRSCRISSCPAANGMRWVNPSIATASPSWTARRMASASETISAISLLTTSLRRHRRTPDDSANRPPYAHSFAIRTRAAAPARTGAQLLACALLAQDLLGDGEGAVGGGNAGVDSGVQQHLADLAGGQPVPQRRPDMQADLMLAAEGGQHGQGHHAALGPAQPGPGPDITPGVPGDEVLERLGKGRRGGD